MLKRLFRWVVVLGVVGGAAAYFFWPERYAVNAPLRLLLFHRGIDPPAAHAVLARLKPPPGFSVTRYAEGLAFVRFLRMTPAGDLLASQPRSGRIVLLERDANCDGRADGVRTVVDALNQPHGLDLHGAWLYVAENDAIGRIRFDPQTRATSGAYERLVRGLPTGGAHWTRTLGFGPDGWMYVAMGSSCNACIEEDARRASIQRYHEDGSGAEAYATGLRNAVGFDWRPGTDELYATDNGRDLLGDSFPPDELDLVVKGGFYGWPFANGNRVPDPDVGAGHESQIAASLPPVHEFRPHNAALGITFVRGANAPAEYRGAALVALHGSWNRTKKDGYKVVSLHWDAAGQISERDFLTGFEKDEDVIGRPVDVAEGPDGALYVSDDYAGSIFRVALAGSGTAAAGASAVPKAAASDPLQGMPPEEAWQRADRGQALFVKMSCASCHDTEHPPAGVVPKPLAGLASRYDVAALDAYLKTPNPPMPAFPFTDDERRDLAVYLLTRR